MNTYKAIFSYDGSSYKGWQKQPSEETIQGTIEKVLIKLSKSEKILVIGSGRTDAGVHATRQVVKIEIPIEINSLALHKGLNSLLPQSIRCIELEECDSGFQPVFHAKKKVYRYYFVNGGMQNPHYYKKVTHLKKEIDIGRAQEVLSLFVGEKDFVNFSTKGTPVKTTIRRVDSFGLQKVEKNGYLDNLNELYYLEITGNGFLKQMVRLIAGAVFSYSESKISKELITSFFDEERSDKVAPTAPPDGLYLYDVKY